MKIIKCSNSGMIIKVDDQDYPKYGRLKWYSAKEGNIFYARRSTYCTKTKRHGITKMHWLIGRSMGFPKGAIIDHRNCDGLDNRRQNLRLSSRSLNAANGRPHKDRRHSPYKGVTFDKSVKTPHPWRAIITKDYKHFHLGRFANAIEAAKAYDKKAKELFGEFAKLNFT